MLLSKHTSISGFLDSSASKGKYIPEKHSDYVIISVDNAFYVVLALVLLITVSFLMFKFIKKKGVEN